MEALGASNGGVGVCHHRCTSCLRHCGAHTLCFRFLWTTFTMF